jgi:hypothetical protein
MLVQFGDSPEEGPKILPTSGGGTERADRA